MEPLEEFESLPHHHELYMAIMAGTNRKVRNLEVLKNHEEIRIMGKCSSFYIKQMAQESIRPLLNGHRLKNVIIVEPDR
jgi:hypothetical protein